MKLQQTLALVLAVLSLTVTLRSHADILSSHSLVYAQAGDVFPIPVVNMETDGPHDSGIVFKDDSVRDTHGNVIYRIEAEARAKTSLFGQSLLRAGVVAYNENQIDPEGRASASARWRDIALVGGPTPLDYITMYFDVHAILSGQGWASSAAMSINAGGGTDYSGGDQRGSIQRFGPGYDNTEPREPSFQISGFDTVDNDNGIFRGTFHFDVPYNPSLGGFPWVVSLSLHADAFGNSRDQQPSLAVVNAMNTLALTQVNDPSGVTIPVSFDSGLKLVPEPTSLTLILLLSFIATRRRVALLACPAVLLRRLGADGS